MQSAARSDNKERMQMRMMLKTRLQLQVDLEVDLQTKSPTAASSAPSLLDLPVNDVRGEALVKENERSELGRT